MAVMTLKILLPQKIYLDVTTTKIIAEAVNGSFTLLPRHIDFLSVIVPGILIYEKDEQEFFVAVNHGILVKSGFDVMVSVRSAVEGPDLGTLEQIVREQFEAVDEQEQNARMMLSRLEVDFIRHYLELQERKG